MILVFARFKDKHVNQLSNAGERDRKTGKGGEKERGGYINRERRKKEREKDRKMAIKRVGENRG